jgi:hydroxymethylpyrimidine pyrophosphatase-like HAD family hydrolase
MNILPRCTDQNKAVMFDIDDTLINSDTGKIIEEGYNLYTRAKNNGYKIVIITARPGFRENVIWTRNQLKRLNIKYNELVFTTPQGKSVYKRKSGYEYILSVGDMDTDLTDSKYSIKISK